MNIERDPAPEVAASTVLVVEDEVVLRMLIADVLRTSGFHVVEAGNADEAMSYVKSGAVVDFVFTDNEMPGSMTGAALVRRLRTEFPKLPCMITSGRATPEIDRLATFIGKPYDLDEMVKRIRAALDKPVQ